MDRQRRVAEGTISVWGLGFSVEGQGEVVDTGDNVGLGSRV